MKLRFVLTVLSTVTVLVASVAYLSGSVLKMRPFSDRTTVSISAPKSNGLHKGSAVVFRGVPIGRVTSVSYAGNGRIVIGISYESKYEIPVSSDLVIENQSMLGESGLFLMPTGDDGPMIESGQNLAAKAVEVPASVPELLGSAQVVLDQVDPTLVNDLVDTLSQALAGTSGDIQRMTRPAQVLAATMIYSQPAMETVIGNMTTMMRDGAWIGPAFRPTKAELVYAGKSLRDVVTNVKPFADYTQGGKLIRERWLPSLQASAALAKDLLPPIGSLFELLVPTARETGRSMFAGMNIAVLLEQAMKMLPGDRLRLSVTLPS